MSEPDWVEIQLVKLNNLINSNREKRNSMLFDIAHGMNHDLKFSGTPETLFDSYLSLCLTLENEIHDLKEKVTLLGEVLNLRDTKRLKNLRDAIKKEENKNGNEN